MAAAAAAAVMIKPLETVAGNKRSLELYNTYNSYCFPMFCHYIELLSEYQNTAYSSHKKYIMLPL